MPPAVTVTLMAILGATTLWGMRAGWRHRAERTASLAPVLPAVPADGDATLGHPVTGRLESTYVSSTVAGDWLERVVAHDLGARARAEVQVFTGGIRIERQGAVDLWVPAAALRDARTAPGMAGKYVGGDGLVVLTWQLPGAPAATDAADAPDAPEPLGASLDTGLRPRRAADRAALLSAARDLLAGPTTSTPSSESSTTTSTTEETA